MTTEKLVCERLCIDFCNKYEEQKSTIRAQEARIAELTTQEEIRKQLESETFEEYDWFYKLKFICRVLGNDGNAPKEDWRTAYGMARSLFDSAWLVQREKVELTKDAEPYAYVRKWHFDGEKPAKVKNENNRWAWPTKFKFVSLSFPKCQPDDVPLYTHPPAPKAITADMVTDEMVKTSVFVNVFNAKQQIANVVNAFNGVKP